MPSEQSSVSNILLIVPTCIGVTCCTFLVIIAICTGAISAIFYSLLFLVWIFDDNWKGKYSAYPYIGIVIIIAITIIAIFFIVVFIKTSCRYYRRNDIGRDANRPDANQDQGQDNQMNAESVV